METSGANDPVWVHQEPHSNRPQFSTLNEDIECDVCIIGSGIAGVSAAYELVTRGKQVVMIEARGVVSGESGRTSGHLTSALDDGYTEIAKKHGQKGAKAAADSHTWALNRVGEVSAQLGIDCEYRHLPAYELSQYPRDHPAHGEEILKLKKEAEQARQLGLQAEFREGLAVKGWDGAVDQRDGVVFANQATFHPTKYIVGVVKWLKTQPNFSCYTNTRMSSIEEHGAEVLGIGTKTVEVHTQGGRTIKCQYAIEATCIPPQKLSLIAEMEYNRTYCIAVRVPKGHIEDCLIYDQAEKYKYVRLTACNDEEDYLIVGGCDHKVGQEPTTGRFDELEAWTRERFTCSGAVDYRWSGQILEPFDYMAFIGKNQGMSHTFVITGDSGDGLTHGVLASKLIADEIDGIDNPWASLYSPSRLFSVAKSLGTMAAHDIQINTQYKRLLQADIRDIEDLVPGSGGTLNPKTSKPIAVYKDEDGNVKKYSALCPHLKGVVCWNESEKTFDCPVHGSRFSSNGVCVMGPAKADLDPV